MTNYFVSLINEDIHDGGEHVVRLVQFSGNSEIAGSVLYRVETSSGREFVLKKKRTTGSSSSLRQYRTDEVLAWLSQNETNRLVVPLVGQLNGSRHEYQTFLVGGDLTSKLRFSVRYNLQKSFEIGIHMCELLADISMRLPASYIEESGFTSKMKDTRVPIGIVHNDLSPANIIISSSAPMLVDWEDVDIAPSIFNLYEYSMHLGSIAQAGIYSRRKDEHYINSWKAFTRGKLVDSTSRFKKAHLTMAGTCSSDISVDAFISFIQYRSQLTGGHLDRIWNVLLEQRKSVVHDFRVLMESAD